MECCLSYGKPRLRLASLASETYGQRITFGRRELIFLASAGCGKIARCEFAGLNVALEPRSAAGRFLGRLLLDDRQNFECAAREQLDRLVAERDAADARVKLSVGSDEALLHRRIAKMKRDECRVAVEDTIYMLILHKFSGIGVHLVPKLAKCIFNGRFEILLGTDWKLQSIHPVEVVDMVMEHITLAIGLSAESNVTQKYQKTIRSKKNLCRLYVASILHGYFLKSVSFRHRLEQRIFCNDERSSVSQLASDVGSLGSYVRRFERETNQTCRKPSSKEAENLIQRYTCALFGREEGEMFVSSSLLSLKRFILEAIAFGTYLWEAENSIIGVYMPEEN